MTLRTARQVLLESSSGGVFTVARYPGAHKVREQATAAGWQAAILDGHRTYDKESLLTEVAAVLEFPDWFGRNWDALADCLRDACAAVAEAGGKGVCLIWTRADLLTVAGIEGAAQTFAEICNDLADEGSPVLVFARSSAPLTELERNTPS